MERRKMTATGRNEREREREESGRGKRGKEKDAIRLGGLETIRTALLRAENDERARTKARKTKAEINRRKSLLPSALSDDLPLSALGENYLPKGFASARAPPFPVG